MVLPPPTEKTRSRARAGCRTSWKWRRWSFQGSLIERHQTLVIDFSPKALIEFSASGLPHPRQFLWLCQQQPYLRRKISSISRFEVKPGTVIIDNLGHRP